MKLRLPGGAVRAVIDVGTNSVKLLVGEVELERVDPLCEMSRVTRLGRGLYESNELQPGAIVATAECVAEFARTARDFGIESLRVIATSAARDARNGPELATALRHASGVQAEIITGEQEAEWVFRGVTSDPRLAGAPLLIMDVGGGSTEFIVGQAGHCQFRRSYQLGVVRELERLQPSDPPTNAELTDCRATVRSFILDQVAPDLNPEFNRHRQHSVGLVGVGGTATVLASMVLGLREYDRDAIERCHVSRQGVLDLVKDLWSRPLAEREQLPGLPPQRADVMLAGAVIYEAAMLTYGFQSFRVSTRGLRYAAILESP